MSEQPVPTVAPPITMRAVVQDSYGTHEVLRLDEVPVPTPGPHEVLVQVAAVSLNAADWHVMRGEPLIARATLGLRRPKDRIQGRDLAGRVVATGAAVTALKVGDEVVGRPGSGAVDGGALAEYVCAAESHLVRRPAGLSAEQAATLPLAGNTALQGVRDLGEVGPGTRLLVVGASGGVGAFAVQIGALLGAEVTGVCSTRNVELVREAGAHRVIDYTEQDFTRLDERFDVVLDMVATRSLPALRRTLTPGGTLVLGGGATGGVLAPLPLILRTTLTAPLVSQRLLTLSESPNRENLAQLVEWAEAGLVRSEIDRVYPLAEAPEAMRHLVEEHARGKILVVP